MNIQRDAPSSAELHLIHPDATPSAAPGLYEKYPDDQPVTTFDAHDLQSLFQAAYTWLASNYELVNRLNVFPVPDGDTGTNMLLTIKSAWVAIRSRSHATVGEVAEAAAEGAHHGSRGNSGVILGQILRGFSQELREKSTLNTHDLALALRTATETAYAAVPAPVEGTILTVAREVSLAAEVAAQKTRDLREFLAQIVAAADASVRHTPELLPVLKQAGVVDSGGKGLFFVFEGMYRALTGQPVENAGAAASSPVVEAHFERQERKGHRSLPPRQWGFDVQYLIEQPNKPVAEIATDIAALGDCPLVEGDEHLVKVHVHVFDPGVALSYGVATGFITDVVVENMDDMAAAMQQAAVTAGLPTAFAPTNGYAAPSLFSLDLAAVQSGAVEPDALTFDAVESGARAMLDGVAIGVIAVTPGPGFAEIFQQLGAHGLVEGGQSMNPSVAEIAEAVRKLPMRQVIILPNNSNILMAAQQAVKVLAKDERAYQVTVIPTRTVPQGVAALTAYDPALTAIDELAAQMKVHLDDVHTGEVTQAVRSAAVDGVQVHQGDIIGLHDGKLVSCGESLADVTLALLQQMQARDATLVTIYYGDFVAQVAAQDFAETVRQEYPEQDIELAYGGQPHYHYILSVE
ncbi:DAK2 domain-containing protein [Caldilinea sp.]|uniref:DAK2 domain-containing protein n=1 Tax=Caldilinea sp. TaxID=2293560 RepID=UPI002CB6289E|nr:DAK2 domain-containing protein [Caldilinea sp.]